MMRGSLRFPLLLALVAATWSPARGCGLDIFGVCRGADDVADALNQLPDKIRKAAEEVLDHVFNSLLPPTIDRITAAAKQLEDRAEHDYELGINATRIQLEKLAEKVVQLAEEYAQDVTKDVEEIVNLVEKDTLAVAQQVISDVDDRVNSMLTRLERDGQELFCAVQGYTDVLEKEFSSYFEKPDCECTQTMLKGNPGLAQDCVCTSCFHIGDIYPRCRCNPWGLQFGPGWYNQGKYDFLKCHLQKVIDWEHWTVDQIVKQLSIVQEAALSFRCLEDMNPGSTGSRDYFTAEYTNVTHTILVWTTDPVSARQSARVAPPGALGRPRSTKEGADPCQGKSIQECLTQAMEQVKEAQADLDKARGDFDSAMALEKGELKIFTSECPQGWVEANMTKGYMLTGRPAGGTVGTQLNRPLGLNETARVPSHVHDVLDPGHTHAATVVDPGHAHQNSLESFHISLDDIPMDTFSSDGHGSAPHNLPTQKSMTGINVTNAAVKTSVSVKANAGEAYPLVYVLVCQKMRQHTHVTRSGALDAAPSEDSIRRIPPGSAAAVPAFV